MGGASHQPPGSQRPPSPAAGITGDAAFKPRLPLSLRGVRGKNRPRGIPGSRGERKAEIARPQAPRPGAGALRPPALSWRRRCRRGESRFPPTHTLGRGGAVSPAPHAYSPQPCVVVCVSPSPFASPRFPSQTPPPHSPTLFPQREDRPGGRGVRGERDPRGRDHR